MPYIITTSEPFDAAVHSERPAFTRRAVATLGEAREAALRGIGDRIIDIEFNCGDVTIGPLPDGTVIEVRPLSWLSLFHEADRRAVRLSPDASHEAIVASYNALQGEAS